MMLRRLWVVAAAVMCLTRIGVAALEQAKPADGFVDSIGINSHYGNSIFVGGNAYANPVLDAKLGALGIRHLRDHTYNDEGLARVDSIYATYGVRANLILGETTRSPGDLVNLLKAHPAYEGIEGLNEPDFNTRSYGGFTDNPGAHNFSATRAFQNDLYNAVKADPLTQNRTILSPAMGTSANSQYLVPIGFDQASMHSYPSGREPTFNLDSNITAMSTLRGTPAKPLTATETGYYNLPAADTGSIPENISGKYLPRLYGEYFNRGITRTYAYELADQGPNTANREENFGLVRYDMTEKPAYTAMENLIDLLEEPGQSGFAAGALDYTITGGNATLHHALLEKSGGSFYLLLWQDLACYNRFAETEIVNAPLPVTLSFPAPVGTASVFFPNDSASAAATYLNTSTINLSVPDRMMVVQLSNVPEPTAAGTALIAAAIVLLHAPRKTRRRLV
jgi:hypothetical protein